MNPDWYRTFFTGIVVDSWIAMVPAEMTTAEVDFLSSRLPPGCRVLDLACGHGRHAVELAARGFRVTGVDISPEFIERARGAARQRGLSADWRIADMREPVEGGPFDAVVCMGNCFGYFDAPGMDALCANIARCLAKGGLFLTNTGTVAEALLPHFEYRDEAVVGNVTWRFDRRYLPLYSREDVTATIVRDGGQEQREYSHHVYTLSEIRRMLDRAGLTVTEALGSLEGEEFRLGSRSLYLTARKP